MKGYERDERGRREKGRETTEEERGGERESLCAFVYVCVLVSAGGRTSKT